MSLSTLALKFPNKIFICCLRNLLNTRECMKSVFTFRLKALTNEILALGM
jgi:hypothetical protein